MEGKDKIEKRQRRRKRVKKKVYGTQDRPRLSAHRSVKHIYAQIIDDDRGYTLAVASSLDKEIKEVSSPKREEAKKVGELLARRSKEKGIEKVVFDRGFHPFSGRIKELAIGAKEGGLIF
ncbi:50S ribosomal protein L18 [bacterium]|nr:50S ribosomal protein L18 [bacterium]MBU1598779.1 50S ribosomal protein L18 [bacterium]MBU2461283.1 50S ribosomal protein L18 [bacterium]